MKTKNIIRDINLKIIVVTLACLISSSAKSIKFLRKAATLLVLKSTNSEIINIINISN